MRVQQAEVRTTQSIMLIYIKGVLYQPDPLFYLHCTFLLSPQTQEAYLANDAKFKYQDDKAQSRASAHY
jgi:hypothetical protein